MGRAARFEIAFRPTWDDVEHIRSSVALCLKAVIHEEEAQEAISMVTAELLENAIKHGGEASDIHYLLSLRDNKISVCVENGLNSPSDANELVKMVDWISGFDEPADAYLQRMQYIYTSDDEVVGGLGLVRVAHEGDCELSAKFLQDGRIEVRAQYRRLLFADAENDGDRDQASCAPS